MESAYRLNILAFIDDFKLKTPDGIVSFDATVYFENKGDKKAMETEVQIITSGNLEAVYLISPEINNAGLPDMFSSGEGRFVYMRYECLHIHIKKNGADFIVSIFPKIVPSTLHL